MTWEINLMNIPGEQVIADLPKDYDYRFINNKGRIAIIGLHPDRDYIFYWLDELIKDHSEHALEKVGIQPAPFEGNISTEKIQRAVDSVNKCKHFWSPCPLPYPLDTALYDAPIHRKCIKCGETTDERISA